MAIFDFLFGSKNPPPVETTNITTTEIPKYIAEPTADIIGEAMDVSKEAYVPYTGPRLAGLSQMEKDAAAQGVGQYMTDYNKKVADIAAQKMKDESAIQQQGIAAKAVQAGGLDSTRFAIQEAERQKNLTTGLGDLYTKAQASAYQTALKAAQQDKAQQLRSAMGMGTVGAQAQTMEQADIQQQLGIGALGRGLDQTALDISYTDFLSERDYPKEQLGFVSNIIRGAPFPSKTTSVGQIPQAQPAPFLQQAMGLGMQGLGMAANLGWQPFK